MRSPKTATASRTELKARVVSISALVEAGDCCRAGEWFSIGIGLNVINGGDWLLVIWGVGEGERFG